MYIDKHLNWSMHLNKLATKLAQNIGILCKLKHFLPSYILKTIYCSLVLPHLQYCTLIWANTYSTKLNKIRMLQKKAVRIINNSDYLAHSEPLFKQNILLKIETATRATYVQAFSSSTSKQHLNTISKEY